MTSSHSEPHFLSPSPSDDDLYERSLKDTNISATDEKAYVRLKYKGNQRVEVIEHPIHNEKLMKQGKKGNNRDKGR